MISLTRHVFDIRYLRKNMSSRFRQSKQFRHLLKSKDFQQRQYKP